MFLIVELLTLHMLSANMSNVWNISYEVFDLKHLTGSLNDVPQQIGIVFWSYSLKIHIVLCGANQEGWMDLSSQSVIALLCALRWNLKMKVCILGSVGNWL